ncbi:hypothetical protein RHMOL_Rhmol12G0162900 [Rhododendron molle]|uniref:Uncharacterized protein n=1 Tax=Rhododendron molle TaxID=49168 RepID=A0ACC0LK41_RHOML|nr:hypothetical protein RHMOL_Rhmol12G0162900 [Rhododendron molle]
MGIKDLLRFMKPYIEPIHIKKYAGKRVGIDAYSWLHKGAYSCSMEICLNTEGDKKFQYLNYFMHRINLLRHHNIVPVVVFDGGDISCKDATGQERSRKRKANLDLAMEKLKEGNRNAASELFQRAVSITPSMAYQLIQILRSEDIEFVVAPYEADAQLAYLSSLEPENGGIIAVISEDSDLLAYGCPAIVFKMDRYGNGEEILLHKVFESANCVPSFRHFDKELFIGDVLSMLKFEKGRQMPEDYPESFRKAVAVFQHARIYDADSESLKHMKPLAEKLLQSLDGDLDFLGPRPLPFLNQSPAFPLFPLTKQEKKKVKASSLNPTDNMQHRNCCTNSQMLRHSSVVELAPLELLHLPVMGKKATVEKSNYFNEATELEKLVCPLKTPFTEENKASSDKIPLKMPENNPFRKRKYAEVQLDELEIDAEQVSVATELERSGISFMTPESQQSVDSKPIRASDRSGISFVTPESHQSVEKSEGKFSKPT